MITIFYKILYNDDVVYVGVTTRPINNRFIEHKRCKGLSTNHKVIEFDRLDHGIIDSYDKYCEERLKVKLLEQKYIKEEYDKGSNLLNLSIGGEWGNNIANKLIKENFLATYGSYDGYDRWVKKRNKIKGWLICWIRHKTENKTKRWIKNWIANRTKNKTKCWIVNWIRHKIENKTKRWIKSWVRQRTTNKARRWIQQWIASRIINKTKRWIQSWISNRIINKTKRWITDWIKCRI